jgi:hypothetical protein
MREFATGATRNDDADKLDYEGFLHPGVEQRFAEYMHRHRMQADGKMRAGDNWQKGIPIESYKKSLPRHIHDVRMLIKGLDPSEEGVDLEEALCAVAFNVNGMLHELLMARGAYGMKREDS